MRRRKTMSERRDATFAALMRLCRASHNAGWMAATAKGSADAMAAENAMVEAHTAALREVRGLMRHKRTLSGEEAR